MYTRESLLAEFLLARYLAPDPTIFSSHFQSIKLCSGNSYTGYLHLKGCEPDPRGRDAISVTWYPTSSSTEECILLHMLGCYDQYRRALEEGMGFKVAPAKVLAAMLAGCTEALLTPLEGVQTLTLDDKYRKS